MLLAFGRLTYYFLIASTTCWRLPLADRSCCWVDACGWIRVSGVAGSFPGSKAAFPNIVSLHLQLADGLPPMLPLHPPDHAPQPPKPPAHTPTSGFGQGCSPLQRRKAPMVPLMRCFFALAFACLSLGLHLSLPKGGGGGCLSQRPSASQLYMRGVHCKNAISCPDSKFCLTNPATLCHNKGCVAAHHLCWEMLQAGGGGGVHCKLFPAAPASQHCVTLRQHA